MPVICIGPVCVPISAVWAVLALLLRPIFNRLPEPVQERLIKIGDRLTVFFKPLTDAYAAAVDSLSNWIPFLKRTPKKSKEVDVDAFLTKARDIIRQEEGGVLEIPNLPVYRAILQDCTQGRYALIIDFGGALCKPCKQIKPVFEAASKTYPNTLFAYCDVNETEDVATECDVDIIPAFHMYDTSGKCVEKLVGAKADQLAALLSKHAPPVEESKM